VAHPPPRPPASPHAECVGLPRPSRGPVTAAAAWSSHSARRGVSYSRRWRWCRWGLNP